MRLITIRSTCLAGSISKREAKMRNLFLFLASLSLLVSAIPASAQEDAATIASSICSSCHGAAGISISPMFPRLAGQRATYIEEQLKAFRSQTRTDPDAQAYMWGMAAQLDDMTIHNLANYYASLPPAQGTPGPKDEMKAGEEIFHNGIPARNLPACAACHGSNAQGVGSFPRLAGQQSSYIVRQLMAFKSGVRSNALMLNIATKLDPKEMRDLAVYLQSL